MDDQDLLFQEQTKAWLNTQALVIQSCDLNIKYFKDQLDLIVVQIKCEQSEKEAKIALLEQVIKNYNDWLKEKEVIHD